MPVTTTTPAASSDLTGAPRSKRFVALDGLRGVAALAVAIGHLWPGFPNTALAVDFFFMLSGFVLVHSYAQRFTQGLQFTQYFIARCIRLLPLIVVGTLIGAVASRTVSGLGGMLLIPSPGRAMYPLDPPTWSLFYEMIASVALGLGLWRTNHRVSVAIALLSGAALAVAVEHRGSIDAGLGARNFSLCLGPSPLWI